VWSGGGVVVAPRVPIVAALTTRSAHELGLREGSEVWASFKAMAVHLC
jgi:molybdopterin-binding protein